MPRDKTYSGDKQKFLSAIAKAFKDPGTAKERNKSGGKFRQMSEDAPPEGRLKKLKTADEMAEELNPGINERIEKRRKAEYEKLKRGE